jgi:hypothetical protein
MANNNRYASSPKSEQFHHVDKGRLDLLQDGLEEIEELKRESESKNDSIVGAPRPEDDDIE